MIAKQPARLVTTIAVLIGLAACASNVNGTGSQATGGGGGGGGTNVADFPTDVAGLGALLLKGNQSIKSAHLDLQEGAGASGLTGSGDELLSNGKLVAIDLTENITSVGTVRYRIVDSKVFAQLPATVYKASKPWVQISESTSNTVLKQLYTSFQSASQNGAGDTVRIFVSAAKGLKLVGTQTLDGDRVGRYSLTVDISSLPADFPNRYAIEQSGLTSIPIELYVDTHGRPRKVTEDFTVSGQHVTVQVSLTKIDAPVTITAPPADQVEQG